MRIVISCLLVLLFAGCKKDKFTTVPQIRYVGIDPNVWQQGLSTQVKEFAPKLTLKITDSEGDIGYIDGSDTAWVFARRVNTTRWDSLRMPNLGSAAGKSFEAEVEVNLFNLMATGVCPPSRPAIDTLFFEVYIQDFAKNKSNIITTEEPVYFQCP